MASFSERMIGAAKLDAQMYEEVEADTTAMGQSMGVVVLSSVAAGIGSGAGIVGLVVGSLAAMIGWFVWAFVTYLIGTKMLPEPQTDADVGQLLRTTGFSTAPGLLRVLGVVPGIGLLAVGVANIWMLVSMVVAVRQALDYESTGRAIGVCLIGWLALVVITMVLGVVSIGALGV